MVSNNIDRTLRKKCSISKDSGIQVMKTVHFSYSDEQILRLIQENNDESAFTMLYDRYFRMLFNYTYSKVNDQFAAQEIVQELFVSIWQHNNRNTVNSCRSYLFSAVKNLIISYYRKEYTRKFHYDRWEVQSEGSVNLTDQDILTSDLQKRYEQGLHLLPPKCKEVFILSRKGNTNKEIALQLSISEKTVEHHITKALRVLKEYLKEHFAYALILINFL
ncbi:RNA polymerase sigma-70 factor, ECF subfamily [Dyadobacter koreensis]|uniref:RNA polymerase sigma factor SigS n=2 Tax=Dyadobacter koreensis TaxID=408657 RepID=A0A1H6U4Q1_9BACT|nr:RNA polymerase sigma-70 factor, ECF subfamily [Dyadobacter koreensis]